MNHAALFSNALGPENGTSYRLSQALAAAFPERAIVQTTSSFALERFAAEAPLNEQPPFVRGTIQQLKGPH